MTLPTIYPRVAPGLIIAAPRSGAGKTTVALGLMRALSRDGRCVQPFKCGPDYIDPTFHEAAARRASFNLDTWAMESALIRYLVAEGGTGCDIAIAEGVMGLFDGVLHSGRSGRGSTADLAALLGWPIVLVLDVSGQTETAAAVALGCLRYREDVAIAGVILNRIASDRHLALIAPAFQRIGVTIFGAVPRDELIELRERHLGLVQASETQDLNQRLETLADLIARHVDLAAIQQCAKPTRLMSDGSAARTSSLCPPGQRIAIARDSAFSFMYPHLLHQWRGAGAEILPFSPLDDAPPDSGADAIWLPGGYPELHAGTLASAHKFKVGLQAAANRAIPIHGECGGYMVLGRGLEDAHGRRHEMAGLLGLETSFAERRLHLGYRRATLRATCVLGRAGAEVVGHEFHYATTLSVGDAPLVDCTDANGHDIAERGARRGAVTGTFFHAIDGAVIEEPNIENASVIERKSL